MLYQLSYAPDPDEPIRMKGLIRNRRRTINTEGAETTTAGDGAPAEGRVLTAQRGRRRKAGPYIAFILSVTFADQAPSGFLVITGSEPPPISTETVFSAAEVSSVPSEPSTSLLISRTILF